MPDVMGLITMLLSQRPELANNPQAKEYLEIIRKGDAKRGEEIANNICKTYNVSKEEGMNRAMGFFQSMFKR